MAKRFDAIGVYVPLDSPEKILYFRVFPALMAADEEYMGLSIPDEGILFRILRHQCMNGSVPRDPSRLAQVLAADPADIAQFLMKFSKLKTLAELEGGPEDRLAIPYLHRERMAILSLIAARRKAGAKGGQRTQSKSRSAQAKLPGALSNVQARLEASPQPCSTEQEQEPYKDQVQKSSSKQQQTHSGVKGQPSMPAIDAEDERFLPSDICEELSRLGIASDMAPDLCERAGGVRGFRAAIELLEAKVQRKEIRSPSGFFLRCVGELAQEGLAHFEQAHREAMTTHRNALADSRWIRLPETCRESLEVLRTWCAWWDIQEQSSSAKGSNEDDRIMEIWSARSEFIETCYRHHPNRAEIDSTIAENQKLSCGLAEIPGMATRLRIGALASLLGLEQKAAKETVPTPETGVAS